MLMLERVHRDPAAPRSLPRSRVEVVLASIPSAQQRDRLLFRLLFETGLRIGEALGLHVEDLELALDDEHVVVRGKGGRRRTVLLDDPRLVKALRAYLQVTVRSSPRRRVSFQIDPDSSAEQRAVDCDWHSDPRRTSSSILPAAEDEQGGGDEHDSKGMVDRVPGCSRRGSHDRRRRSAPGGGRWLAHCARTGVAACGTQHTLDPRNGDRLRFGNAGAAGEGRADAEGTPRVSRGVRANHSLVLFNVPYRHGSGPPIPDPPGAGGHYPCGIPHRECDCNR